MIVFSIIFLSQAILEVPTGLASDLLGRRKTMVAGALISFVALFLYATGLNIWVLFVGAFCYENKNSHANLKRYLAS